MDRHFSELGLGNGRSGSSKKGKKSNSDKPKQPQRGLGVAQLEKIRLHSQMAAYLPSLHSPPFHSNNLNKEGDVSEDMACSQSFYSTSTSSSSLFGLHPNNMMASGDNERHDIRYSEFQSGSSASNFFMAHNLAQETVTLPLLEDTVEDPVQWPTWQDRHRSTRTINQNSDSSSDTQELDLDLKLSL